MIEGKNRRHGSPRRAFALSTATLTAIVLALCLMAPSLAQQDTEPSGHHAQTEDAARAGSGIDTSPAAVENASDVYVDGTVIAFFEEGATADAVNASIAESETISPQQLTEADMKKGFAELSVRDGQTVEGAVAELKGLGGIEDSLPNYLFYLLDGNADGHASSPQTLVSNVLSALSATIDDERQNEQWYLDEDHGVNAYDAWDLVKCEDQSTPVTVAVIDSGCNIAHEDLAANVLTVNGQAVTYDATPINTEKDNYSGSGTGDISADGHGTHVCGTVAAQANNGKGIAGVSYNAKFLPIQVFRMYTIDGEEKMSAPLYALLNAYDYIINCPEEYNIKVANMSFGAKIASNTRVLNTIDRAYQEGVLPVCAAGNADLSNNITVPYAIFPGDYLNGHGLNVIASDKDRKRPSYSNYNGRGASTKDITAPGGSSGSGKGILSTLSGASNNGYGELYGTSMATPIASGVAALVFAANPSLTPGQVIDVMHSTATDLGAAGWDETFGYGLVNAYEAVRYAQVSLEGASEVIAGGTTTLEPSNAKDATWTWRSSDTDVATVDSGAVRGVGAGTATITATHGSFSISKDITVYSASINGAGSIDVGSKANLTLNASPAGGTWSWSSSDAGVATVVPTALGATVTGVARGSATITAALSTNPDVKATFALTVSKAETPVIPVISSITLNGASTLLKGGSVTLTPSSGEGLAWASSDPSVATVRNGVVTGIASGKATISASNSTMVGTKTVTVYEVAVNGSRTVEEGSATALTLNASPAGGTWSWSSSDEGVATVVPTALSATVAGVSPGSATITAALSTNPDVKATLVMAVTAKPSEPETPPQPSAPSQPETPSLPDVSNPSIEVNGGPFAFTGGLITPSATVRAGGKPLVYRTDYTLVYTNATNAGNRAMVTAKGLNLYKDRLEVSTYFTINKAAQKISAKTTTGTISAKSVKSRSRTVRCIKVSGKKSQVAYKKTSGSSKLSINKSTGLVTVKKNTKKGSYSMKVSVVAKESPNFKKSNTVTKTVKVKVK